MSGCTGFEAPILLFLRVHARAHRSAEIRSAQFEAFFQTHVQEVALRGGCAGRCHAGNRTLHRYLGFVYDPSLEGKRFQKHHGSGINQFGLIDEQVGQAVVRSIEARAL
ncbi:MAG: hypothetical protein JRG89_03140 [Deltaproteobacteria bacterium]|nr:hypothetical protein [Deltaproteobacteria bacterium]MBW2387409.1 hypothetical protein [Deltaproteobacteria bacterium]MBW2723045.1 hypothetical protein [Deltaproteobacteria bacterium]